MHRVHHRVHNYIQIIQSAYPPPHRTLAALAAVVTLRVDHAGAYMSFVELVDAQFGLTAPLHGRIDLWVARMGAQHKRTPKVLYPRCSHTPVTKAHMVSVKPPQMA